MHFDPYATWLVIPADRRPPTYYDLLGVAVDEPDPAAIEQAALRRMSKVRQHQIGPHSDLSQQVLSELARARLVLMDPDRRAEYDATLHARNDRDPVPSAQEENNGKSGTTRRRSAHDESERATLRSLVIVDSESDGPKPLRPATTRAPHPPRNRLVIGTALTAHAAILGAALVYFVGLPSWGPAITNLLRNERVAPKPAPPVLNTREKRGQPPPRAWQQATTRPGPTFGPGRKRPDPGRGNEPPNGESVASREDSNEDNEQELSRLPEAPEDVLTKRGLKVKDSVYVLEGEAEAREKGTEMRRLQNELKIAEKQRQATVSPEARQMIINGLADEIEQCRIQMRNADEMMNRIPRWLGQFHNPGDAAQFYMLRDSRDQTQAYVDMASQYLNRLKREPFDPGASARTDAMVREFTDSSAQARDEFWKVVEATDQKYKELARNPEVKKALQAIRSKTRGRDLGPTREFKWTVEGVAKAKKAAAKAEKARGLRHRS